MSYSYDRTKTASFQDRAKGGFEVIVWIDDFMTLRSKGDPMLGVSGTVSILVGGDSGDTKFSNAIVRKRKGKWVLEGDTGNGLADVLLSHLVANGAKLPNELDRIHTLLSR